MLRLVLVFRYLDCFLLYHVFKMCDCLKARLECVYVWFISIRVIDSFLGIWDLYIVYIVDRSIDR